MEKFNNKGFSMGSMITFIIIFIGILIAVMFIAYNNGVEKDSPSKAVESKNGWFITPDKED